MNSPDLGGIVWRTSSYTGNNGNCVEVGWRTSSHTGDNGNCVEVAMTEHEGVAVRDTKHRTGPTLSFPNADWRAFLVNL
jgi:hypothetical protein